MSYRSRAQWDFWIQFHSDYSIPFRFPNLNLKSVHMCFLQFFSFTIVQISQTSTKFCSKVPVCRGNLTICVKMAQSRDKKTTFVVVPWEPLFTPVSIFFFVHCSVKLSCSKFLNLCHCASITPRNVGILMKINLFGLCLSLYSLGVTQGGLPCTFM